MKTPTIYDIKYDYQEYNPNGHYFDRKTMQWFGQTLKDFHVNKTEREGVFYIWAYSRTIFGNVRLDTTQKSEAYYNMFTHKMSRKLEDC